MPSAFNDEPTSKLLAQQKPVLALHTDGIIVHVLFIETCLKECVSLKTPWFAIKTLSVTSHLVSMACLLCVWGAPLTAVR